MKRAITGIVAASLTLGTMAPAAFAATASAPSYFGSKIAVGTYSSNVQAIKAQDAGNTIAMFPFYYIQAGLQSLGYTVKWDGVAKRLDITTPDGITLNTANLNPGVGDAGIYINGTLVQRAPFSVANDKGGNNKPTAFMATYYLNQALAHIGFNGAYNGTGAGWTLTAPVANPAVTGVTQLNADQVKVSFNAKVDSTSAGTIGNYFVNGNALTGNDAAAVSADGKSVVLTLTSTTPAGLTNGTAYAVKVSGVKAAAGATFADFSTSFIANDTTAPSAVSASATAGTAGTNTVTVTFSEPISYLGTYYIDGQAATATGLSGTDFSKNNVVTLTSAQVLKPGENHTLTVASQSDARGNSLVSQSVNFTVVGDTTAGTFVSGTVTAENVVKLTYSKKVDSNSIAQTNLKTTTIGAGLSATAAVDAVDPYSVDVTFSGLGFNSTVTSILAYVSLSGLKDVNGNTIADVTNQQYTLKQDLTAPSFQGATVSDDGKYVLLTFNKAIATASLTGVTAVDSNGVLSTGTMFSDGTTTAGFTSATTVDSTGTTPTANTQYVKLSSSTGEVLQPGTYTVSVPAGNFVDHTIAGNSNAAFKFTFTVNAATNSTPISIGTTSTGSVNPDGTESFDLALGTKSNGTALNPANYSIDGTGLPSNTLIVFKTSAMDTVTITVPAGTFAASAAGKKLWVSNVQNSAGKAMTTAQYSTISVVDNTVPTVTSAVENLDGTVTLNFSEPVTFVSGAVTLVKADGTTDQTASVVAATASSTAKVTIDLTGKHVNQDTLTVAAGAFKDGANNTSAVQKGIVVSQTGLAGALAASGAVAVASPTLASDNAAYQSLGYDRYSGVDVSNTHYSVLYGVSPDGSVLLVPQDTDTELSFAHSWSTGTYTFYGKTTGGAWEKFTISHVLGQ